MARRKGRLQNGSIPDRVVGLFLTWENEHREVTLTRYEIAAMLNLPDPQRVNNGPLERALWRLREKGLVKVATSSEKWEPALWTVPADIGERYEAFRSGNQYPAEPIITRVGPMRFGAVRRRTFPGHVPNHGILAARRREADQ